MSARRRPDSGNGRRRPPPRGRTASLPPAQRRAEFQAQGQTGNRLGWQLTPREIAAVAIIAIAGIPVIMAFPNGGAGWLDRRPVVLLVGTVLALGASFSIERRAIMAVPVATLRYSGAGLLAPFLWWILGLGALTPIAAIHGLTAFYLGVGSVTAPAAVALLVTGIAFGAGAGYAVGIAALWAGTGALLLSRRPRA